MGARAVRITREELLTPPEFRGLHLGRAPGGPDRRRRIELVRIGGRDPPGGLLPAGPGSPDAAVLSSTPSRRPCST